MGKAQSWKALGDAVGAAAALSRLGSERILRHVSRGKGASAPAPQTLSDELVAMGYGEAPAPATVEPQSLNC